MKTFSIVCLLVLSTVFVGCGKSKSNSGGSPSSDNVEIPGAGTNDSSFQTEADSLLVNADAAWREHSIKVSVESDIPFEHRRDSLKIIAEGAARQDLVAELKRLGIQTIQTSSTNTVYVNNYHKNEVTLTWKLNQSVDLMLEFLKTK